MSFFDAKLGDVLTLKRGHDLPEAVREPGPVPVVSSSGMTGYHNQPKVTGPGVVTGRYGTLGEVFFIDSDYWPLNTALYVCDFKGNNPRYLAYLLKETLQSYQSDKTAVPVVDRKVLHALDVRAGDRPTQDKIVDAVSAYDDLIDNNRRRMALLEDAARQIYKEWFIHLRFPGHKHVPILDGVPERWSRARLGDLVACNPDSFRASQLPQRLNDVDLSAVKEGRIHSKTTCSAAEAPGRAKRRASPGDVTWANVRPNLRGFALLLSVAEDDVFSTGFTVLRPIQIPSSYLYLVVTTDQFVGHLVNHATGASYPAVRP